MAVTKLDRQSNHRFPFFLPDGRQFLFQAVGTPETAGIYLGSLDSAETWRLTTADTAGVYLVFGMAPLGPRGSARGPASGPGTEGPHRRSGDPGRSVAFDLGCRVGIDDGSGRLPGGRDQPSTTGLVRPDGKGPGYGRRIRFSCFLRNCRQMDGASRSTA